MHSLAGGTGMSFLKKLLGAIESGPKTPVWRPDAPSSRTRHFRCCRSSSRRAHRTIYTELDNLLGRAVSRAAATLRHEGVDAALERQAAPRRFALRQGQCGVAGRPVPGV